MKPFTVTCVRIWPWLCPGGHRRRDWGGGVSSLAAQRADVSHLSGHAEEHNDHQRVSAPLLLRLHRHRPAIWVKTLQRELLQFSVFNFLFVLLVPKRSNFIFHQVCWRLFCNYALFNGGILHCDPPQEQGVPHLQEEVGLQTFSAQRFKLRCPDLEDLPEPRRVRGSSAQRPGAPQQAAQQGSTELQHRRGAPPAGPLQVWEAVVMCVCVWLPFYL